MVNASPFFIASAPSNQNPETVRQFERLQSVIAAQNDVIFDLLLRLEALENASK